MNIGRRKKKLMGRHPKNAWAGKVAVLGLLERNTKTRTSKVRTMPVSSAKRRELQPIVVKNVEDGTTVYTDKLPTYETLSLYFQHQVIDHAEKYVDGQIHTNGMENYWSLLKRTIRGTYVSVEPFHLFRYLDEQAFRFNERSDTDGGRFARTLQAVTGRRITFNKLTGKEGVA